VSVVEWIGALSMRHSSNPLTPCSITYLM
jgi:hypothetical protein